MGVVADGTAMAQGVRPRAAHTAHAGLLAAVVALVAVATAVQPVDSWLLKSLVSDFREGEAVPVTVGKITSPTYMLPMGWSTLRWWPAKVQATRRRSVGDALFGDTRFNLSISLQMKTDVACATSEMVELTQLNTLEYEKLIRRNYRGNIYVDNLPGINAEGARNNLRDVSLGFPVGVYDAKVGKSYINNHLHLLVYYHPSVISSPITSDVDRYSVVEFQVLASSRRTIDAESDPEEDTPCEAPDEMHEAVPGIVRFTYSVSWIESELTFGTRWDVYVKLSPKESRIYWFSITNFLLVIFLLSMALWFILVRALRRDFSFYNDPEEFEESREEIGWKIVHGDVFRKPAAAGLLTVMVGSGAQLAAMAAVTLAVLCVGVRSPSSRGFAATVTIFVFVLLSFINGFITAMLSKLFKARSWKIVFASGFFFPAQLYLGYLLLNFIHLGSRAASSAPLGAVLMLFVLWVFVSLPLCVLGATVGFSCDITIPVKISNIPRSIPPAPWYLMQPYAVVLPGLLPFTASYIQLVYIFSSIWQGQVFYLFGFLTIIYGIVVIICAQTTIFATYIQLNALDYRWWWRSFAVGGSYGLWVFVYATYYYVHVLSIKGFWSFVLYFGYSLMICYALSLLTGAVSFLATAVFLRVIYSNIKVD